MMKKIFAFTALAVCFAVHAAAFRIEAENLIPTGKWQIGQHARQYSNGKMIVGLERKGELKGSYKLAEAGKYQVWVRTMTQGQKWRKGNLSINGKELGSFGDEPFKPGEKSGAWHWIKLKEIELPAGKTEFKITTPMGYVRIDAVILSNDEKYTPPENPADIAKVPALPAYDKASALRQLQAKAVKILLFNGGRPWQADSMKRLLASYGFQVAAVSGQRRVDRRDEKSHVGFDPVRGK